MTHLATRLSRHRRHWNAPVEPFKGAPSSMVMASVAALAVIGGVTPALENSEQVVKPPPVKLPVIATQPVDWRKDHLLVSVTTDDLLTTGERKGGHSNTATGACRVFIDDRLVTSEELYDESFSKLDGNVMFYPGGVEAIDPRYEPLPPVFLRADRSTPWRCIAGAIYNVQAAGYAEVKFLTRPVA